MRKKNNVNTESNISSIIGEDMVIEGNITAKEAIRIEGTVTGDIISKGALTISASGKVLGDIKARNILVGGAVKGNLDSESRIEVLETGKVTGNITTKSLIVDENAVFQGQCIMNLPEQAGRLPLNNDVKTEAPKKDNK